MNSLQLQLASYFYSRDLDALKFFLKKFFHALEPTLMYMMDNTYWRLFLLLVCLHISRGIATYIRHIRGKGDPVYYYYDYGFADDEESDDNLPDPPDLP